MLGTSMSIVLSPLLPSSSYAETAGRGLSRRSRTVKMGAADIALRQDHGLMPLNARAPQAKLPSPMDPSFFHYPIKEIYRRRDVKSKPGMKCLYTPHMVIKETKKHNLDDVCFVSF